MVSFSLCMIVKDEELSLDKCLKSVEGLVDEIIIVDTGSVDKTKQIAQFYNAQIYDLVWKNDYSLARNFSFSKATKDYILWLNADEVILEEDKEKLLELKRIIDIENVDYIKINNNISFDSFGYAIKSRVDVRITKREKKFIWHSPISEYLEVRGPSITKTDISITNKRTSKKTSERTFAILNNIKSKYMFSKNVIYRHASELYFSNKYEEALDKYIILLKWNGLINSNFAHDVFYSAIRCLKYIDISLQETKKISKFKILQQFLDSNMSSAELFTELGNYYGEKKELDRAIFWTELATSIPKPEDRIVYNEFYHYIPYVNLCSYYYQNNNIEKSKLSNENASICRPTSTKVVTNRVILENAGFKNLKVGILIFLRKLGRTYSLVSCVAAQISMLLGAGIKVTLLVSEFCKNEQKLGIFADERIEWKYVKESHNGYKSENVDYTRFPEKVNEKAFIELSDAIALDLEEKLRDLNFCFLHDILFQYNYTIQNLALRKVQPRLPDLKYLHFSHSFPKTPDSNKKWPFTIFFESMPNTKFVALCEAIRPGVSRQFSINNSNTPVVNNIFDCIEELTLEVRDISNKVDLYSPDILIIYPSRLNSNKQHAKIASLAGAIKTETGKSITVLFCDSYGSNAQKDLDYKNLVKKAGQDSGLSDKDLYFTSELGYPHGLMRKSVLDLFSLSNLFIFPSNCESFGLILLEAASQGNFIVLNGTVPALKEIGNYLNAYFMEWNGYELSGYKKIQYNTSEEEYLKRHAKIIVELMSQNSVIRSKQLVRQKYNPRNIFKTQVAHLLK